MIWTHLAVFLIGLASGWGIVRLLSSATSPIPKNPAAKRLMDESSPSLTADPDLLKDLKERLQKTELAYRMVMEMGQFKAGFLARTSHELRSPLNSIMSLQQLILTDLCDSPEEEREFIAQSYAAAQKLLALLNETTNVSKLEHGTIELHLEPLSLAEMLGELESLVYLHAQNRNLKLKVEQPSPDLTVMGDRRWLRQVLLNLVTTPIYQMDGGTVRVSVHPDVGQQQVQIQIEDERPPQVWSEAVDLLQASSDPDPSGATSGSTPGQGAIAQTIEPGSPVPLGLNLAINQILMEKMNGAISLVSVPEDNAAGVTCIQCSIPLTPPGSAEPR